MYPKMVFVISIIVSMQVYNREDIYISILEYLTVWKWMNNVE